MITAISGDPFLAERAARRLLKAKGFAPEAITELSEPLSADDLMQLAAQGGLFGQRALLLDLDSAFVGQAGVKPRNALLEALKRLPPESELVILDRQATPARQKLYRELGDYQHYPTPRFGALVHWIRQELTAAGVGFAPEVPEVLADLFGEDLPAIAAEIEKLAVLEGPLDGERVRQLVNRLATRNAFDLIAAIARGEAARALAVCQSLTAQGEAPARVLGALSWQFQLVARVVALRESRPKVDAGLVSQTFKVKPFVAQKALAIAQALDEARLAQVLTALLAADMAVKTGRDGEWALTALTLKLARLFAANAPTPQRQ